MTDQDRTIHIYNWKPQGQSISFHRRVVSSDEKSRHHKFYDNPTRSSRNRLLSVLTERNIMNDDVSIMKDGGSVVTFKVRRYQ